MKFTEISYLISFRTTLAPLNKIKTHRHGQQNVHQHHIKHGRILRHSLERIMIACHACCIVSNAETDVSEYPLPTVCRSWIE